MTKPPYLHPYLRYSSKHSLAKKTQLVHYIQLVFAYGQTGSGKTHTMNGTRESPGLYPKTIAFLLDSPLPPGASRSLSVTYLEIYNEKIIDLLANQTNTKSLEMRETPSREIIVVGATSMPIVTMRDFEKAHGY